MTDCCESTNAGSRTEADLAAEAVTINRREWWWLVVTTGGLLAVFLSPIGEHLTHLSEIRNELAAFGAWAPAVFIAVMTGLTAVGIPRMLMYPIAGAAFGFGWGLMWSLMATVSGGYLTYMYARWAGRGMIIRKWPKLEGMSRRLRDHGFLSVAIMRQLPGPGVLYNLLLGISAVRRRSFIGGTALGALPSAIPALLIGTSLSLSSSAWRIGTLIGALVWLAVLWTVCGYLFRRWWRPTNSAS
ncbi:MAG TPA: VTT domain-containing protein [Kiritimatiellia bacterium]|nr:VTT domain-containing protein [Kiritimatiellia bacterium]